jgi:hypothetical protein
VAELPVRPDSSLIGAIEGELMIVPPLAPTAPELIGRDRPVTTGKARTRKRAPAEVLSTVTEGVELIEHAEIAALRVSLASWTSAVARSRA